MGTGTSAKRLLTSPAGLSTGDRMAGLTTFPDARITEEAVSLGDPTLRIMLDRPQLPVSLSPP